MLKQCSNILCASALYPARLDIYSDILGLQIQPSQWLNIAEYQVNPYTALNWLVVNLGAGEVASVTLPRYKTLFKWPTRY